MGYDLERFQNPDQIDVDLRCVICMGVLKNPVQTIGCKHVYCKECLDDWLRGSSNLKTCPSCRTVMQANGNADYSSADRLYFSLINKLKMKCSFVGCAILSSPENIHGHEKNCVRNPATPVDCKNGCGQRFRRRDQENHNCVAAFRNDFNKKIAKLEAENRELKADLRRMQKEERDKNFADMAGVRGELGYVHGLLGRQLGEVRGELHESRRVIEEMKSQMRSQQAESIQQFKQFRDQMAYHVYKEVSLAMSSRRRMEELKFEDKPKQVQIAAGALSSTSFAVAKLPALGQRTNFVGMPPLKSLTYYPTYPTYPDSDDYYDSDDSDNQ